MNQRFIRLFPLAEWGEVWKLTYPPVESTRRGVVIEAMKLVPHDGVAKQ